MNQRSVEVKQVFEKWLGVNQRISPSQLLDNQILNCSGVGVDQGFVLGRLEGKILVEQFANRVCSIYDVGDNLIIQTLDSVFKFPKREFLQALQNPETQEEELTFSSAGDNNGVFYFLGTRKGKETWGNPTTKAQLGISGDADDTGTKPLLVNRTDDVWKSIEKVAPAVIFDLGLGHELQLTTLTIKSASSPSESPKHLSVEGSNDGQTWTGIYQVANLEWTANEWKVFTINATDKYRYFRILHSVSGLNQPGFLQPIDFYVADGFDNYPLGDISELDEYTLNVEGWVLYTGVAQPIDFYVADSFDNYPLGNISELDEYVSNVEGWVFYTGEDFAL